MKKIDLEYGLYMAETEGLLNTRESKLQKVIKEIKKYPAVIMPESAFKQVLMNNGIEPNSLTEKELNRINSAVGFKSIFDIL